MPGILKSYVRTLIIVLCLSVAVSVQGQEKDTRSAVSVKTNLLSDALANINLGAEATVGKKWSVNLTGDVNFWNFSSGKRWKHWLVMPEVRWWWCDNTSGSFLLAHLTGGRYNVGHFDFDFDFLGTDFSKLKDYRYEGWMAGAGLGYGYSWALGRHWSLEAVIAAGWIYSKYDQYRCKGCQHKVAEGKSHNYVGLTQAALNIIYAF